MKLINGFIFALALSLSLGAQESPAPTPTQPADAPIIAAPPSDAAVSAPEPAPQSSPAKKAEKPAAKTKPAKKAKAKTAAKSSDKHTALNPPETGIVKGQNCNVRGRPSFIGEVITKLNKGEKVTLLEEITLSKTRKDEPANWFKIVMPSNTPVWVSAHFVDPNTKLVLPRKLQVRAGPGENYSTVGMLQRGTAIKEIRAVDNWIEIETPADTYAFIAADLVDRAPAPTPTPTPEPVVPEPAPEVVAVPPDSTTAPAPAEPPVVTEPVPAPEPMPEPPVVTPAPQEEEPLPKRIVTREGIVRRSYNVQTPSYYELESLETEKPINYLYSSEPDFSLKDYVGTKVLVTGEEYIDQRWPKTPVLEIDTLEQE